MSVAASLCLLLLVFYAGAVVASGRCWLALWRGRLRFQELRDLTGIGDRAALRRIFGLTSMAGFYRVSFADVVRRRRMAGLLLTDTPVHLMFLAALTWALLAPEAVTASAILAAAAAHAFALAVAALSILAAGRHALTE